MCQETDARFPPLPGLKPITQMQLQAGGRPELFALYGGLGSGRLVVTGAPGSGKSGAAILLLDALQHRERVAEADRPQVPVPVLFTLHGWDPSTQRLEAWLAERLVEDYPLFAGRNGTAEAAALLAAEKLAVILDGLDEIAEDLRPTALQALSEQARCRVVLLTRSDEMVAAALKAHFAGAVALEMQDVDSMTAADYLTRTQLDPAPTSWQRVIDHLHREHTSPVAQVLNTPLTLTLVRDTYTAVDDVAELLDSNRFPSRRDIEDSLLDRVLPAAYAHRLATPRPRYSLEQADRTLRYLAKRMNQDATRDLAWWRIPEWVPAIPRSIVTGLAAGLVVGLVAVPLVARESGLGDGLAFGLAAGVFGLAAGWRVYSHHARSPKRIGRLRWRSMISREALAGGLYAGLLTGLLGGLLVGFLIGVAGGLGAGLLYGLLGVPYVALPTGLVGGLLIGARVELSQPGSGHAAPSDPLTSWRYDRNYWLVVGLVGGLWIGLVFGETWATALACTQLGIASCTPVRMIRFLEEARSRHVLRTVGPIYQFRHARLQDRLAGLGSDRSHEGAIS